MFETGNRKLSYRNGFSTWVHFFNLLKSKIKINFENKKFNKYYRYKLKPILENHGDVFKPNNPKNTTSILGDDEYYLYFIEKKLAIKPLPIICRKSKFITSASEFILDLNNFSSRYSNFILGYLKFNHDFSKLAWTFDPTGEGNYQLAVKNLKNGTLSIEIDIFFGKGFFWNPHNGGIYILQNLNFLPKILWHLDLAGEKSLIYHEKDISFWLEIAESHHKDYIILNSISHSSTEHSIIDHSNKPLLPVKIIARSTGCINQLWVTPLFMYKISNKQHTNNNLSLASIQKVSKPKWQEIIKSQNSVFLETIWPFQDFIIVKERLNSFPRLKIKFENITYLIPIARSPCDLKIESSYNYKDSFFWIEKTSFIHKKIRFRYESTEFRNPKYSKIKKSPYFCRRLFVNSYDGKKIPVTISGNRKFIGKPNPAILTAYGAYGQNFIISNSSTPFTLLDSGVLYICIHVRGGLEQGNYWYEEGKLQNKKNSIRDFLSCYKFLCENSLIKKPEVLLEGSSAGAIIIGNILNRIPNSFKGVYLESPFLDLLNSMEIESLPFTKKEYLEWGNPQLCKDYQNIKSNCPYQGIRRNYYPNILIRSSLMDRITLSSEALRWVEKIRQYDKSKNQIYIDLSSLMGHNPDIHWKNYPKNFLKEAFYINSLGLDNAQ